MRMKPTSNPPVIGNGIEPLSSRCKRVALPLKLTDTLTPKGLEPLYTAQKAVVLPIKLQNQTRAKGKGKMGRMGFEPILLDHESNELPITPPSSRESWESNPYLADRQSGTLPLSQIPTIEVAGFEPTIQESKSCALPLGYTSIHLPPQNFLGLPRLEHGSLDPKSIVLPIKLKKQKTDFRKTRTFTSSSADQHSTS